MTLLVGTPSGLYRADPDGTELPFDAGTAERTLTAAVRWVRTAGGVALAATDEGLYRSTDGREWERFDVYARDVTAVLRAPGGERTYVGTMPVGVYYTDDWEHWRRCDAIEALPARDRWRDRARRGDALVRALAAHPDAPDRVLVGIESGGVLISDDRGDSWRECSLGVHDDVHHLLAVEADTYVAATGDGLYRTTDAGDTWLRLDTDHRDFWYSYHRESTIHRGRFVTAALAMGRQDLDERGAIYEGDVDADARSFERLSHPGDHESFVVSFASDGDDLLAGTMRVRNGFERRQPARVLRREAEGWTAIGIVPAAASSLAVL
ncbi:MAG: WD40/YVTN/BNR-like repeat-containing protein [Haloferacaceae archaeon]